LSSTESAFRENSRARRAVERTKRRRFVASNACSARIDKSQRARPQGLTATARENSQTKPAQTSSARGFCLEWSSRPRTKHRPLMGRNSLLQRSTSPARQASASTPTFDCQAALPTFGESGIISETSRTPPHRIGHGIHSGHSQKLTPAVQPNADDRRRPGRRCDGGHHVVEHRLGLRRIGW
jgi:hypothetical protein